MYSLNSESEPPLTLISARVKSEEDSESSNSMRADSPTISLEELELIAMVGGVVSGGGAMEKGVELLLSLPSLLKLPAASENGAGNVDGSCAASFFDWIRGEDSGVFGASAFEFRE